VGKEGLKPDTNLLKKISDFSGPLNYDQARSFLGTTQLYRRFIYRYSDVCKPIRDAINAATGEKGKEIKNTFVWTEACSAALKTLQAKLSSEPVHRLPRPDEPYYMFTDASKYAIGCVLCQKEGDDFVIVLCDSVVLPKRKYWNTTEGESFAVVHFTHKFSHYVDNGLDFTVFTDHTAVQHALDNPSANAKLTRWGLSLLPFRDRMFIHHWPGEKMPADFFSRHPNLLSQEGVEPPGERYRLTLILDNEEVSISEGVTADSVRAIREEDQFQWIKEAIAEEQQSCEEISPLYDLVKGGTELRMWPRAWSKYRQKGSFRLDEDKVLVLEESDGNRRQVAPESLRLFIMSMSHDNAMAAHFKNERFFGKVEKLFWWPKMRDDLVDWQTSCEVCQLKDPSYSGRKGDYKSVVVTEPFSFTAMDLVGPLPMSRAGNRYILVFTDYFTRWVEAVPLKKAESIARAFYSEVACRWGAPLKLLTDKGKDIAGNLMQEVHVLLGTDHLLTTPYHPEADGMVERFNGTLISHVAKLVAYDQRNWDELLPPVLFAYRTSPHSVTNVSPFRAMTGFDARTVLDASLIKSLTKTSLEDLDDVRQVTRNFVRENDQRRLENTAAKNAGNKPNLFKVGELVLVQKQALPEDYYVNKADRADGVESKRGNKQRRILKLADKFEGPFIVQSVDGNRLKMSSHKTSLKGKNKKDVVVAEAEASHVKHYRLPGVTKRYITGEDDADWQELSNSTNTVDTIVQHKDTDDGRQYLVKWFGRRDKRNNEWLSADEFHGDRSQLIQYERGLPASERRMEQATRGVDTTDLISKRIRDAFVSASRRSDESELQETKERPRKVRFAFDGTSPSDKDADEVDAVPDGAARMRVPPSLPTGAVPMSESFRADGTGDSPEGSRLANGGSLPHTPRPDESRGQRNLHGRTLSKRNRSNRESGDASTRPQRIRTPSSRAREADDR
jgi:hypothetical protein